MGKRGRGKPPPRGGGNKDGSSSSGSGKKKKKMTKEEFVPERDMDDEIDAFHKQRDFIPMDVNRDDASLDSDEDDVLPVFDNKDINGDEDDEDDDEDNGLQEQYYDAGLAARIVRQQKYLRQRVGGVEDEMHDNEEDVEEKKTAWGRGKKNYYDADEIHSDDEELPEEEEQAVLELQRERAKNLSMEDFGLEGSDDDTTNMEPTMEERSKSKVTKSSKIKGEDVVDMTHEASRDLSALSPEEQMEAVYSSSPELVGMVSELSDAQMQLENEVNPLLKEIKDKGNMVKGMNYFEVKRLLLLSYCQAITFYLLLKSEAQSTHDHPVIDRIAQVKSLMEKMKKLDENLPSGYKDAIKSNSEIVTELASADVMSPVHINPLQDLTDSQEPESGAIALGKTEVVKDTRTKGRKEKLLEVKKDIQNEGREEKLPEVVKNAHTKGRREKYQVEAQRGQQNKAMLKYRASLEEKLRQKGILGSLKDDPGRTQKPRQKVNGQLETLDDFDDDAMGDRYSGPINNGNARPLQPKRLSDLITSARASKLKAVSGEDDLLARGDIGERLRRNERQVLRKTGIEDEDRTGNEPVSEEDDDDDDDMEEDEESGDEMYQQAKRQKAQKLAAKQKTPFSGTENRFLPEETVDGKRHISYQMEKNRGLTRNRKKLDKNPRTAYKLKAQKQLKRRQGQVLKIRKQSGAYGGEVTGINSAVSRSVRFKS